MAARLREYLLEGARGCVGDVGASADPSPGMGQLAFDPLKVKVTISGSGPSAGLRNYYDFIR